MYYSNIKESLSDIPIKLIDDNFKLPDAAVIPISLESLEDFIDTNYFVSNQASKRIPFKNPLHKHFSKISEKLHVPTTPESWKSGMIIQDMPFPDLIKEEDYIHNAAYIGIKEHILTKLEMDVEFKKFETMKLYLLGNKDIYPEQEFSPGISNNDLFRNLCIEFAIDVSTEIERRKQLNKLGQSVKSKLRDRITFQEYSTNGHYLVSRKIVKLLTDAQKRKGAFLLVNEKLIDLSESLSTPVRDIYSNTDLLEERVLLMSDASYISEIIVCSQEEKKEFDTFMNEITSERYQ